MSEHHRASEMGSFSIVLVVAVVDSVDFIMDYIPTFVFIIKHTIRHLL